MPAPPKPGESEKEWMQRCMHTYKQEGDKPQKQRVAICLSMWRRKNEDVVNKIDQLLDTTAVATGSVATNTARGHIDVVGAGCPKGYTYSKEKKICVKSSNEGQVWAEKAGKKMWISDDPRVIKKYKDKGWKVKEKTNESAGTPKKGDRFIHKGKKLTVTYVGSGLGHDKYITVKYDNEKIAREIKMTDFFKGNDYKYIKESTVIGGTYGNANTNIASTGQTRVVGARDGEITVLDRSPRPLRFNRIFGAYLPSALKSNDELQESKGYFIKSIVVNDHNIKLYRQEKKMTSKVDLWIDDKKIGEYASQKIAQKEGEKRAKMMKEAKKDTTQMQCMECGKRFRKRLGPRTFEVKCPKCSSYDTEPV